MPTCIKLDVSHLYKCGINTITGIEVDMRIFPPSISILSWFDDPVMDKVVSHSSVIIDESERNSFRTSL